MIPGLLVTDGGPHPADKWAATTAAHITSMIQIDQNSPSITAKAARRALPKLELDLAEMLEGHHDLYAKSEREHIERTGGARLNHEYVKHEDLDAEVADVMRICRETPFAAHFADPHVQYVVRSILQSHFASNQHIERSWHADKNPAVEHSILFRARYHAEPMKDRG